jgi:hypothetical protein
MKAVQELIKKLQKEAETYTKEDMISAISANKAFIKALEHLQPKAFNPLPPVNKEPKDDFIKEARERIASQPSTTTIVEGLKLLLSETPKESCIICGGTGSIVGIYNGIEGEPTRCTACNYLKANCMDCDKPYEEFGMDIFVPHSQWVLINPDIDGLLCAQCIINRVSKIGGATVIHAIIEFHPNT